MNRRGYIRRWEEKSDPRTIDYHFTSNADLAATWDWKDQADIDCRMLFDRQDIRIPSMFGGLHVCSGFKSEERPDGKFVVFCEAPFVPS